jgi:hypothetical protein
LRSGGHEKQKGKFAFSCLSPSTHGSTMTNQQGEFVFTVPLPCDSSVLHSTSTNNRTARRINMFTCQLLPLG